MKSLKTVVNEVVLAGLCGVAFGGAFGYSADAVREMQQEVKRPKIGEPDEAGRRCVYVTGWPKNKTAMCWGAAAGGVLALTIYAVWGNKKNVYGGEDSEKEEQRERKEL